MLLLVPLDVAAEAVVKESRRLRNVWALSLWDAAAASSSSSWKVKDSSRL
jgi:hypothetical protein